MALTKIETQNIEDGAISTPKLGAEVAASVTLIQSVSDAANLIPAITSVNVANSTYDLLDDTAVSLDGGYIVINGTGFSTGAQVLIDGTVATSVTRVSSTQLQVEVPAKTAASYNLYVVNNTGHTAIKVNGLTYSGTPTWVTGSTLDPQSIDVAFSVAFDATGATSYANTTVLPAGTALLSNGYFYGTITGIEEETIYNFTVAAIDDELQDSPREFSITVTVTTPGNIIYGSGYNSWGNLGQNTNINGFSSPVLIGTGAEWIEVNTSFYLTIGLKNDGTLWSWGQGTDGGLGLGDAISRSSPVQIGSLTNWNKSTATYTAAAAIKTDGTLWTWGKNDAGQLGLNDVVHRSSPVQVGTATDWNIITGGYLHILATKTNDTAWSWGANSNGQLGQNDILSRSSPTQIGSSTWQKIHAGLFLSRMINSNGTLWNFGQNTSGQLGVNDIINKSSPVQLGTATDWADVSGRAAGAFLKTNGTLWTAGVNNAGQLGHNNIIYRSSPVQVAGTWSKIAHIGTTAAGIKSDGTLWTWGGGAQGQLGQNDTLNRSSPTQLGTDTDWTNVSGGGNIQFYWKYTG